MRTNLGRPEFGSFTLQKAYITFPLLSSSTISSRPPSAAVTRRVRGRPGTPRPPWHLVHQEREPQLPLNQGSQPHLRLNQIPRTTRTKLTYENWMGPRICICEKQLSPAHHNERSP